MKRNILLEIAGVTKGRVAACKTGQSLSEVKATAVALGKGNEFVFEKALRGREMAFICEVKKASPSKGIIAEAFPYLKIAKEYEIAGAAAISVLTEPDYFMGSDKYLQEISEAVNIPVLRKDFVIDEYQIYEAKCLGASAVLLICALLDINKLRHYREIADSLGMSCLIEAHNATEIAMALQAGARVIGVNNRNLADFTVDVHNSLRLRDLVPENVVFVSESGIKTADDIECLHEHNVSVALIGETFMRSADKVRALAELNGKPERPLLKVCGLKTVEDAEMVNQYNPDMVGFVFAAGKRQVTVEQAAAMRRVIKPRIKTVGVFVNASVKQIIDLCQAGIIDIVQLHGDETEAVIQTIKAGTNKLVIRAVAVKNRDSIKYWQDSMADMLLFDTYSAEQRGGTGKVFDWMMLNENKKPFMLAGGLNKTNLARAIYKSQPTGVDISSGVETAGKKDAAKIAEIIELIRGMTK